MPQYGPWILFAVAVAAYFPRFFSDHGGMQLYPAAAQCLLTDQVLQACSPPFTYPPAFAFAMIPFVPLPMWLRNVVWYLVTWGAIVLCWWLCERLAGRLFPGKWSDQERFWFRLFAVLLSAKFVLAVLENQAHDAFSFAFIAGGLWAVSEKRPGTGGVLLGIAAAIKATPLIFLPYLLLKRRFVAAGTFVAAYLLVSFLPDIFFSPGGAPHGYFIAWLSDIAGHSLANEPDAPTGAFWAGYNLLNHSLRGAVARLINEATDPGLFKAVLYGTWLAFIAVAGALLLRSPNRDEYIGVDGSILVIGMLMLSPMTSQSHYVVLMLPYIILSAALVRTPGTASIGMPVLIASFILATASGNDLVGDRVTDWAYAANFMEAGALVLLVYLGVLIWRGPETVPSARHA